MSLFYIIFAFARARSYISAYAILDLTNCIRVAMWGSCLCSGIIGLFQGGYIPGAKIVNCTFVIYVHLFLFGIIFMVTWICLLIKTKRISEFLKAHSVTDYPTDGVDLLWVIRVGMSEAVPCIINGSFFDHVISHHLTTWSASVILKFATLIPLEHMIFDIQKVISVLMTSNNLVQQFIVFEFDSYQKLRMTKATPTLQHDLSHTHTIISEYNMACPILTYEAGINPQQAIMFLNAYSQIKQQLQNRVKWYLHLYPNCTTVLDLAAYYLKTIGGEPSTAVEYETAAQQIRSNSQCLRNMSSIRALTIYPKLQALFLAHVSAAQTVMPGTDNDNKQVRVKHGKIAINIYFAHAFLLVATGLLYSIGTMFMIFEQRDHDFKYHSMATCMTQLSLSLAPCLHQAAYSLDSPSSETMNAINWFQGNLSRFSQNFWSQDDLFLSSFHSITTNLVPIYSLYNISQRIYGTPLGLFNRFADSYRLVYDVPSSTDLNVAQMLSNGLNTGRALIWMMEESMTLMSSFSQRIVDQMKKNYLLYTLPFGIVVWCYLLCPLVLKLEAQKIAKTFTVPENYTSSKTTLAIVNTEYQDYLRLSLATFLKILIFTALTLIQTFVCISLSKTKASELALGHEIQWAEVAQYINCGNILFLLQASQVHNPMYPSLEPSNMLNQLNQLFNVFTNTSISAYPYAHNFSSLSPIFYFTINLGDMIHDGSINLSTTKVNEMIEIFNTSILSVIGHIVQQMTQREKDAIDRGSNRLTLVNAIFDVAIIVCVFMIHYRISLITKTMFAFGKLGVKKTHDYHRTSLDFVDRPCVLVDDDGLIMRANAMFLAMVRSPIDHVVGQNHRLYIENNEDLEIIRRKSHGFLVIGQRNETKYLQATVNELKNDITDYRKMFLLPQYMHLRATSLNGPFIACVDLFIQPKKITDHSCQSFIDSVEIIGNWVESATVNFHDAYAFAPTSRGYYVIFGLRETRPIRCVLEALELALELMQYVNEYQFPSDDIAMSACIAAGDNSVFAFTDEEVPNLLPFGDVFEQIGCFRHRVQPNMLLVSSHVADVAAKYAILFEPFGDNGFAFSV